MTTDQNYPTKELVWQIRSNIAIGAVAPPIASPTDYFWKLKEVLTGKDGSDWATLLNPWTVVSSCDGSSVSEGGDLLTTANNFVFANEGTAHSWIILEQPITKMQLLISSNDQFWWYNRNRFSVWASYGGFSGGTTIDSPSATDFIWLVNRDTEQPQGTGFLHVWHNSSDGSHTRFASCISGITVVFATFDAVTPQVGVTWDSPNVCSYLYAATTNIVTFNNYKFLANMHYSKDNVLGTLYCGCESWADQWYPVSFTTAMVSTGTWCVAPITGLWGTGGKYAMPKDANSSALPDILWGCTTIVNGSGYLNPDGDRRDWVQLGNFVLPWDNTVIQTA